MTLSSTLAITLINAQYIFIFVATHTVNCTNTSRSLQYSATRSFVPAESKKKESSSELSQKNSPVSQVTSTYLHQISGFAIFLKLLFCVFRVSHGSIVNFPLRFPEKKSSSSSYPSYHSSKKILLIHHLPFQFLSPVIVQMNTSIYRIKFLLHSS